MPTSRPSLTVLAERGSSILERGGVSDEGEKPPQRALSPRGFGRLKSEGDDPLSLTLFFPSAPHALLPPPPPIPHPARPAGAPAGYSGPPGGARQGWCVGAERELSFFTRRRRAANSAPLSFSLTLRVPVPRPALSRSHLGDSARALRTLPLKRARQFLTVTASNPKTKTEPPTAEDTASPASAPDAGPSGGPDLEKEASNQRGLA
jgi:hypothetical protein